VQQLIPFGDGKEADDGGAEKQYCSHRLMICNNNQKFPGEKGHKPKQAMVLERERVKGMGQSSAVCRGRIKLSGLSETYSIVTR